MTEQEFRAAVLEVFPRSHGINAHPITASREWHARIGERGGSFWVEWHGNARRGLKWHVYAGRLVGKSSSLREAVAMLQSVLSDEASKIANQQNALEWAMRENVDIRQKSAIIFSGG